MATVVFVGQSASKSTVDTGPFSGASAKRLAEFLGLSLEEFRSGFRTVNLFEGWPGKKGKGDAFDLPAARESAAAILSIPGHYVCLGKSVAAAFGVAKKPMLEWQTVGECQVAWLPHTSGLNLFYNSAANRTMVIAGLQRLLGEAQDAAQLSAR